MTTSNAHEPAYRYRVVGKGIPDSKEMATEAEAQALANAMRDRDFARCKDVEVERSEKVGRAGTCYWLKREGQWRHSHYVRQGLSREEMDALDAEYERKRAEGPQPYVGTFRSSNFHPNTGQCLKYARVEFKAASVTDANDLMWEAFGDDGWYDAIALDRLTPYLENGSLWTPPYYRVSWPTPPEPPGVTVTLRVVLTEEQAAKSDLWIEGRCIVHRPAASGAPQPGAGVTAEGEEHFLDAFYARRPPGIGHAGLVLRVRFFRRDDALRAVAADPENVSIVEGTESLGTFRHPAKVWEDDPQSCKNRVRLTGAFDIDALYEIAEAIPSFKPVYRLAADAREAVGEENAVVELVENRVVAVHVVPPDAYKR